MPKTIAGQKVNYVVLDDASDTGAATSNALYFVARGDGTSYFSATLDEHNAAVNRYQRGGASNGAQAK